MHSHILTSIALFGIAVNAQGVVNNGRVAANLRSQGVPIEGNYKIKNVKTGATITYIHNDQANFLPTTQSLNRVIDDLDGESGTNADNVLELVPSFRNDGSTRIRNVNDNKVISAQWDFDIGRDEYGVAYACAYGTEPECTTDSLEPYKQFWLFIPVDSDSLPSYITVNDDDDSSSSKVATIKASAKTEDDDDDDDSSDSSDDDSSSDSTGCSKAGDWLYRNAPNEDSDWYVKHPECLGLAVRPVCTKDAWWLRQHTEYVESHPECKSVLKKAGMIKAKRDHKSIAKSIQKRASPSSGYYYIVSMDHIEDMTTRSLSGTGTKAFADAWSVQMVDYDDSDPAQMWEITKV